MIRHAAILAVALLAGPAAALSCLPPDAVELYTQARDAESDYWVVRGRIRLKEPLNRPEPLQGGGLEPGPHADTRIQVLGRVLIGDGSFHPFARNVTLRLTCLSVWCGDLPVEEDLILALEVTNDQPVLSIDPCRGTAVPYDEDGMERLLACHTTGDCVTALPY